MDELKRAYQQARVISIALIAGLFLYVIVVEVIRKKMAPFEGFSPFTTDYILRYVLFACAISMFLAIKVVKNRIFSDESRRLSPTSSLQPTTSSLFASKSTPSKASKSSSLFASKPSSASSLLSSSHKRSLFSPPVQRLVSFTVISLALCETVAIYGLVIFLINGSSLDFYLFLALSFVFIIIHFPRYSQWEDWIKKIEMNR